MKKNILPVIMVIATAMMITACGTNKKPTYSSNYVTAPHSIGGVDTLYYTSGAHGTVQGQAPQQYSQQGYQQQQQAYSCCGSSTNYYGNQTSGYSNNYEPNYVTLKNQGTSGSCSKPQISGQINASSGVSYYNNYVNQANQYLACINQQARSQSSQAANYYRAEEQEVLQTVNLLRQRLIR